MPKIWYVSNSISLHACTILIINSILYSSSANSIHVARSDWSNGVAQGSLPTQLATRLHAAGSPRRPPAARASVYDNIYGRGPCGGGGGAGGCPSSPPDVVATISSRSGAAAAAELPSWWWWPWWWWPWWWWWWSTSPPASSAASSAPRVLWRRFMRKGMRRWECGGGAAFFFLTSVAQLCTDTCTVSPNACSLMSPPICAAASVTSAPRHRSHS